VKGPATENILDYPVACDGVGRCVESIAAWVEKGEGSRWLACINPHSYAEALKQPRFSAALHSADWLVPDGAGIVLASRVLGGRIRERVTGGDIFREVLQYLERSEGHRVFFLGATEDTLAAIRDRMARDYPRVKVAGTYSPPFRTVFSAAELDAMVAAINAAEPDVLWVGMTAPKQELWIQENLKRLPTVRFAAGIGAEFDFYTGRVKRSHPVFQRIGLEWLPRLIRQPRRLWRRMFVSAPIFLWHLLRVRVGANSGTHPVS
jgi:N-acetylglucosaminyldiphosphoundecaprenol N-acetyl-beta-D-mannosaminyltransferase